MDFLFLDIESCETELQRFLMILSANQKFGVASIKFLLIFKNLFPHPQKLTFLFFIRFFSTVFRRRICKAALSIICDRNDGRNRIRSSCCFLQHPREEEISSQQDNAMQNLSPPLLSLNFCSFVCITIISLPAVYTQRRLAFYVHDERDKKNRVRPRGAEIIS